MTAENEFITLYLDFKNPKFPGSLLYFPGEGNIQVAFDPSQIFQSESQTSSLSQASEIIIRFA